MVVGLPVLLWRHRRAPLSHAAYGLLLAFGVLHEVGAHYTYAEVPYDVWARSLSGRTVNELFGWQRNHFDRLVHFLYGLLLYVPVREWLVDPCAPPSWRDRAFPLSVLAAGSMLFELFEWWAALLFGGDLGQAYLGTQGDIWDAHADMALALAGSMLAAAAVSAPVVMRRSRMGAVPQAASHAPRARG